MIGTVEPELDSTLECHRRELLVHCYRMTGSFADAEDLTQESLLRAWRRRDEFEGRASVRTWLYRIATNACLDHLKRHERRSLPSASIADVLERDGTIQPFPDAFGLGSSSTGDPADAIVQAETTGLLLMAALLQLPPRQRAAFIARDLLDFSAGETASLFGGSTTTVNSLVQRARRTMRSYASSSGTAPRAAPADESIVARYVDAHHQGDVDALLALVADDVRIAMPPEPPCLGSDEARRFFAAILGTDRPGDWRLVATRANGAPSTANYLRAPGASTFRATSLDVLHLREGRIEMITCFLGDHLFPMFGLPLTWDRSR